MFDVIVSFDLTTRIAYNYKVTKYSVRLMFPRTMAFLNENKIIFLFQPFTKRIGKALLNPHQVKLFEIYLKLNRHFPIEFYVK